VPAKEGDRTGLAGRYQINLEWAPENDTNRSGRSLSEALEMQLGLRMERRREPLDVVLGSPVRFWELVVASWLAGLLFFLAASAFTLVFVALLDVYQGRVDAGAVLGGYAGVVLVGSTWVAVGLLAAALTRHRAVAVAAGILALLGLQYAAGTAAGFLSPPLSDVLDYASAANRAQSFERGQAVLRDTVYFVSLTVGALLLTARALASRRWR